VGAPCGCIGNFAEFDRIQGNWVSHPQGGHFKVSDFNSLTCGCDCNGGDTQDADFSNGQVCGDRICGPTPPAAPANLACFTGTGVFTPPGGKAKDAVLVAYRVEIRDHGEPNTGDEDRLRIWIPDPGGLDPLGTTAADIAQQVACGAGADGSLSCNAFRNADFDGGFATTQGNLQIHRDIGPHEGFCPNKQACPAPPDGTCPFGP